MTVFYEGYSTFSDYRKNYLLNNNKNVNESMFMDRPFPCVQHYHAKDNAFKKFYKDYTGPDFNYNFNSLGFRSPELDKDNPALASFGCSHTMGVGVPEASRFSYVFAKKLGLINYDFSVSGCGNLDIIRNLVAFLKKDRKNTDTRMILIAWSHPTRSNVITYRNEKLIAEMIYPAQDHFKDKQIDMYKELWHQYGSQVYTLEIMKTAELLCELAGIPLIQFNVYQKYWTLPHKPIDTLYQIDWKELDKGRDASHFGIQTHAQIADLLYDSYTYISK